MVKLINSCRSYQINRFSADHQGSSSPEDCRDVLLLFSDIHARQIAHRSASLPALRHVYYSYISALQMFMEKHRGNSCKFFPSCAPYYSAFLNMPQLQNQMMPLPGMWWSRPASASVIPALIAAILHPFRIGKKHDAKAYQDLNVLNINQLYRRTDTWF